MRVAYLCQEQLQPPMRDWAETTRVHHRLPLLCARESGDATRSQRQETRRGGVYAMVVYVDVWASVGLG